MFLTFAHAAAQPGFWSSAYNIVGVLVGLLAVTGALVTGRKAWRRFVTVYEVLVGVKGGQGARSVKPLVDIVDEHSKLFEFVLTQLAEIRRQVTPNGGNTDVLADRVVKMQQHMEDE